MHGLRLAPIAIERLLRSIDPTRFDEPTAPDRFSPREAISHMADFEPIFLHRLQVAKQTPGATVEVYDEGQMAIDNEYHQRNPLAQAAKFRQDRLKTIEWLESLSPSDWGLTVENPEKGTLSIEDQANLILGHDMYHVEHLTAYLGEKTAGTW